MATVGLRELRQDASDLVRRAEAGEEITITVSGRPSARLIAAGPNRWCRWEAVQDLFSGEQDRALERDLRDAFDDDLRDPWLPR